MTVETYQLVWEVALSSIPSFSPVCLGENVIVADQNRLRAFARSDGTPRWEHTFEGKLGPVIAADDACIVAINGIPGDRVVCITAEGEQRWELEERWQVGRNGLAASGDRFILAGLVPGRVGDSRLLEARVSDAAKLREIPGWTRSGFAAIPGGWAWLDAAKPYVLRVLDDEGERVLGTDPADVLATWGRRIYTDLTDGEVRRLRAYDLDRGLVWDRPGGGTRTFAVDEDAIACGRRDGEAHWLTLYDHDGNERWSAGPFRSRLASLRFWGGRVVASGVSYGGEMKVVVLDRADGRLIAREPGSWTTPNGGVTVDGDRVFTTFPGVLRCREHRTWARIEDAWPPVYLREVCKQLDRGLSGKRTANTLRLRAAVKAESADLDELRDAVAAARQERGESKPDRPPPDWLFRTADWPLILPAEIDDPQIPVIEPITPDSRVELINLDDVCDYPVWQDRAKLVLYPNLRFISMMMLGLDGGSLGIKLFALPALEYLNLAENALVRVPPEVRECAGLIYLSLRKNQLRTLDPEALPPNLRYLDVKDNPLAPGEVTRFRAARPDCHVEHYPSPV